jgi:hypothetical protein
MLEIMTAAGGGVVEGVLEFLGKGGATLIYAPLVYCAVFHEPTTRRVVRLLRAIRSGKADSDDN